VINISFLAPTQVHTKRRNKLLHDRMRDLVFVKFNSKTREKRENKRKDPIEREFNDVLEDELNEFITGVAPTNADQEEEHDAAQDGASQEPSMAQAQVLTKRKRSRQPRKKKLRSLHSIISGNLEPTVSASSSDSDDSMQIESSDSAPGDDE